MIYIKGQQEGYIYFNDWAALRNEIQGLAPSKIFVLVDENTEKYCLFHLFENTELSMQVIKIESGERHKNLDTCQTIWQSLMNKGADRQSLLINLGGGVIGDMGGFCAGTYMRGIRFIQMPTTLLSQVDASIGGKTGIDFMQRKNMIGLFGKPEAVFVFTKFLKTLPKIELRSGFAEMLKHALIADKESWDKLTQSEITKISDWESLVYQSILTKLDITNEDPYESGKRKILNFGHTIGHAIESYWMTSDKPLLHGEAIAIGMIAESFIAYRMGLIREEILFEIRRAILHIYGHQPRYVKPAGALISLMRSDKKNHNNTFLLSLPDAIGQCRYDIPITEDIIAESLIFYGTVLR